MDISNICASECRPKYTEWVYTLRCPDTFDIFYVGKTIDLKQRLFQHIQEAKSSRSIKNDKKCAYINKILATGRNPVMGIIDKTEIRIQIDKYYAFYKELFWIKLYNKIGWNLTNVKDTDARLDLTDYFQYKIKRSKRSYSEYYYGIDINGNLIYDIQRILNDGLRIPEIEQKPEEKIYNPWHNTRFITKNGLDAEDYTGEYFTNMFRQYEDENINEY